MAALNSAHVQAVIQAINAGPYIKHLAMVIKALSIGSAQIHLTGDFPAEGAPACIRGNITN